jgi:uncharacterized protein involved in exopolysaccharide biosynthesis
MTTRLHARLIAETDKLAQTAQAQVAQLQEALQNCQDRSAAQRQVLTQLKAARAKVLWLHTLKEFVLRRAKKLGHSLNVKPRASPYDRAAR